MSYNVSQMANDSNINSNVRPMSLKIRDFYASIEEIFARQKMLGNWTFVNRRKIVYFSSVRLFLVVNKIVSTKMQECKRKTITTLGSACRHPPMRWRRHTPVPAMYATCCSKWSVLLLLLLFTYVSSIQNIIIIYRFCLKAFIHGCRPVAYRICQNFENLQFKLLFNICHSLANTSTIGEERRRGEIW